MILFKYLISFLKKIFRKENFEGRTANFRFSILPTLFLLGIIFVFSPINFAKAIDMNQQVCANTGTGDLHCNSQIYLDKTDYSPNEHITATFFIGTTDSYYTGTLVGPPNNVTFNGAPGTTGCVSGNNCVRSSTATTTLNAASTTGCYGVPVKYDWTGGGATFSYTVELQYSVYGGCNGGGGGGGGGGSTIPEPVITFNATSPIYLGSPTTLSWSASPAKICQVFNTDNNNQILLSGSAVSGSLPNTPTTVGTHTYQVNCENNDDPNSPSGVGFLNEKGKKFTKINNYFEKFKNPFLFFVPEALADIVNPGGYNYSYSTVSKTVTVLSPVTPTISLDVLTPANAPNGAFLPGTVVNLEVKHSNYTTCSLIGPGVNLDCKNIPSPIFSTFIVLPSEGGSYTYTADDGATDSKTLVVTSPDLPDLTASVPTPTFAVAGVSKTFTSIISNNGNASTGSGFTNVFQTATGFDDSYNPIGLTNYESSSVAIGAGLTSTTTSPSITFPEVGTYWMRVCADNDAGMSGTIAESIEGNNCSYPWTEIIVNPVTPKPDLTVIGSVSPSVATLGVAKTFSSTVKNQGNAATGGTGSKFYNFYQITDIDPNSPAAMLKNKNNFASLFVNKALAFVGLIDLPRTSMTVIAANASKVASTTYTFNSIGTYWMRACADKSDRNTYPGDVNEVNEGNNCGVWTAITVTDETQKPDLVAGNITPRTATVGGKGATFYSTISNNGNASTGSSFTNVVKVSNNPSGTPFQSVTKIMSTLGSGMSSNMSFTHTFTSTGTYYVQVCADQNASGNGTIDETDETNNCTDWVLVTIVNNNVPIGTLVASDCYILAGSASCDSELLWAVTNPITGANTAVTTTPPDNTIVPGTNAISGTTKYPVSNGPGNRVFYLYHDAVQLASATANATCAKGSVWNDKSLMCEGSSGVVDLVASAVAPQNAFVGQKVFFSSLITNQGDASTINPFANLFQMATKVNEKGDAEDAADFSQATIDPYLAGGASQPIFSEKSYSFEKSGIIYVRACADKENMGDAVGKIGESNEDNNCGPWTMITATEAMPDLVAGITNPPAFPVGQQFNLSASITNQGNAATIQEFLNIFELADSLDGDGNGVNPSVPVSPVWMNILDSGLSKTMISKETLSFDQPKTMYVRACADKQSMDDQFGSIEESVETNNCGPWTMLSIIEDQMNGVCSSAHYNCLIGNSTKAMGSGTPLDPWTWFCEGFNGGGTASCSEISGEYCNDKKATNWGELLPCEYKNCSIDGKKNGNETGIDCGGPDCPSCGGKKPKFIER